jgi:pyridoxal phosphate enzyme (YggS family)
MSVADAIKELRRSIHDEAINSSHHAAGITLVIVTKTVPPEKVREAYDAGERDFGENRVQEWQEKKDQLPADVRWHLIGHLQTNKVKYVVGQVHLIHSLDRIELADEIERQAASKGVSEVPCLLQVNMSGEETKSGVDPAEAEALVEQIAQRPRIKLKGIMTIGPLTDDEHRIHECFLETRELFDTLQTEYPQYPWEFVSMGMSNDYRIAIEEGGNMLRIGSLIFGARGK